MNWFSRNAQSVETSSISNIDKFWAGLIFSWMWVSSSLCHFFTQCNIFLASREIILRFRGHRSPREFDKSKEMATHSSILAWRIPRTEEPGGLQSTGSYRVGHDWATSLHFVYRLGGLPRWLNGKQSACQRRRLGSIPGSGGSPVVGNGSSIPYSCLENPHGQRNLAGHSPRGGKEPDSIWRLNSSCSSNKGGNIHIKTHNFA